MEDRSAGRQGRYLVNAHNEGEIPMVYLLLQVSFLEEPTRTAQSGWTPLARGSWG